MLNENHAFILDFPEFKLDIVQLNHDDPKFKNNMQKYPRTRLHHSRT